ncbi:hybrid sensor histidine kinase/response regulator [Hydrogenovibrio kuenenii]|uniref:hybrid sensor histidine kinase/response regulator n=1 Tax=Hydrogenovibrio kuenenii TaxID=63658 RepID=UPI000463674D|nr:ATP-binding protein [Hydrogenovibrio kuenenii]
MKPVVTDISKFFSQKALWWCLHYDEKFAMISLSEAFESRLGAAVLTSDDFMSYMVPESIHHFMTHTQALLEKKTDKSQFLMGLNIDGELVWLINELYHQKQGDNEVICATCIDITHMYKLEERLIASHSDLIIEQLQEKEKRSQEENTLLHELYKSQTKFLAMLSHELRTPLMGMNSLINVVKHNQENGRSIEDPLRIMKLTVDQLNFLINDILTYSQTESEHIQINPSSFTIDEMSEYVTHLTKSISNDKGMTVSVTQKTHSEWFYGDLLRISQILVNLIVNAIKFTHKGGVFVEIEETSVGLLFSITDSGEGIEKEQLERIFEPFKQLKSKGSQQYFGSGLGLPIVKRLVELLGGTIEVESVKGVGTKFTVELPVGLHSRELYEDDLDAEQTVHTEHKQKLIELSEPLSVLIADDSVINRKVLELFLHEINCVVEHAENGKEAWQKFLEQDFDIVFLDIQMPEMDGMEVCRKIRTLDHGLKPKLKGVYALTAAHTEDEISNMGIVVDRSLFDDWIEKPISQDKVFGALYKELIVREELAKAPLIDLVPESLVHLLPQFVESTSADLKRMHSLLSEQDETTFRQVCHSLKGNLMLFEVKQILSVVKKIENLSFTEDSGAIETLLSEMDEIYHSLY